MLFVDQCRKVDAMCDKARMEHYQNLINTHSKHPKELYKIVNGLLNWTPIQTLPHHVSLEQLAETFADFFHDKIQKIRTNLTEVRRQYSPLSEVQCDSILTHFEEASEDEVRQIIIDSATKLCELDAIPTWLLKECLDTLLPVITKITNLSMSTGMLPDNLRKPYCVHSLKRLYWTIDQSVTLISYQRLLRK